MCDLYWYLGLALFATSLLYLWFKEATKPLDLTGYNIPKDYEKDHTASSDVDE